MDEVVLTEKDVPGAYLSKDPSEYTVPMLKRWLECHGQKKTGNLSALVERIRGCTALKLKVDPRVDGGKWYELKKKGGSLSTASSTTKASSSSDTKPSDDWTVFPSVDIPEMFNYGHAYYHLIESVANFGLNESGSDSTDDSDGYSGYTTTEKPLRKARKLIASEYVVDIQDNKNEQHYFIRAHVHHSMKNEYPLNVSVVLSKASGFVVKASCDCKSRALTRCAHVAAVLLTLVDYTDKHGHRVTEQSTSKACVWNRGKKRAKNPNAVHETNYKSRKVMDGRVYNWDPRPKELRREVTSQEINKFIIDLQSASVAINEGESMWETSLRISYEDYELTNDRRSQVQDQVNLLEENLSPPSTTAGRVSAVEIPGTSDQSNSPTWFRERQYRLTASNCKGACLLGDQELSDQGKESRDLLWKCFHWISKNLWFSKTVQTSDMKYGISEEPKAREAYTKVTGNRVKTTGLWVNKKFSFLAASPDGLATEKNGKTVLLEIKCLKLLREMSVTDLVQQCSSGDIASEILNRQCFKITDGKLILQESHVYYYQVQLLLLVTDLDFCDFVLHSPKGPPSVQRIPRDENLMNRLKNSLSAFWHKVLAPEIFEMRVPRNRYPFLL